MFEKNCLQVLPILMQNTGLQETNQQRFIRIKKSKNIRKDKVMERRIKNCEDDLIHNHQVVKDTKKDLQKEKNRMAAQLSRDRQKKYVEDLTNRVADLEKQIQSKLCHKCKAAISENSTSEQQNMEELCSNLMDLPKGSDLGILNYQQQIPEFDEFPLIRDNSTKGSEWGNIGKYFCLCMMVFAVALLSNSIETTENPSSKQMTRILTQRACSKQVQLTENKVPILKNNSSQIVFPNQVSLTKQQFHNSGWPFKKNTGSATEQCKNNFWNSYLQNLLRQQNGYDWNLVSCTNPNMIHISTVYEQTMNSLGGKWTFLITNPTVSHSHVEKGGNHLIDQVNYLKGVYEVVAQGVVLKKVMGQYCLA